MTKSWALALGMIAGTSVGAILNAVTGEAWYLGIGVGIGMSAGLAAGAMLPANRERDC
jgi:hypothetical protein